MHIADGILPVSACIAGQGLALAGVYAGGRRIEPDEVVRMGMMSALTFVVSLMHFPLGGTSVHLGLYGLTGIMLRWRALPVIYSTLLFQALAFGHGGLLSLGINSINMGAGCLVGAALWRLPWVGETVRSFAAGFAGIAVPAALIAAEFFLAGYGKGVWFLSGLYLAAAAIEGVLTAVAITFLRRVKPSVFGPSEYLLRESA